jgi:hypothetical protein
MAKKQYPPFYEKAIPIAVLVVVLLLVIIKILAGL